MMFPELVYQSYHYNVQPDGLHIAFQFQLNQQLRFEPTAFIPNRSFLNFNIPTQQLDLLVFNIGMIELISYWKAYCPPIIRIVPHTLTDQQISFWKKLYWNGLGEFFYVNQITTSINDFVTIVANEGTPLTVADFDQIDSRQYLVPVGGGKDSVVTLELLRSQHPIMPVVMNPRGATIECCKVAGFDRNHFIEIQRTIHPLLLELNAKGALNGHTPFSAMLAFYTLLIAALSGKGSIALSNENSANESTIVGSTVNHQYSKSIEFENDFRTYVRNYIGTQFNYFSFLRPLSELQIAKLFSQYPAYHQVFKSCNVGSKQDIWCCACPKCLFAFIILSPFLPPDKLKSIFGENILDDTNLTLAFRQLIGVEPTKPFECVGTVAEVHTALRLALGKYKEHLPLLLQDFEPDSHYDVPLNSVSDSHNLSLQEIMLIRKALDSDI
ncbi:MAG: hypothetical protein KBT04_00645 [Bacteroidales bacterium]|nr:hypothetical protein [Candidatus Colimorpha onthohippi]